MRRSPIGERLSALLMAEYLESQGIPREGGERVPT